MTIMNIQLKDILKISDAELRQYKLHLAGWNGSVQPLNEYLRGWDFWLGWNAWRGNKNDFNRPYIFSLIQFYHEPNKWLFGGIFKVTERLDDYPDTEIGYKLELVDLHQELIGRLVMDFYRYQGMRGRAFLLESYYKDFVVAEILKRPFDGINFPGYENICVDFTELEMVYKYQKNDWKAALQNVKGVYVIVDRSNGKKYVGSAYGDTGIWSRWAVYVGTGHGFNDELTKLIALSGMDYARKNFRFTLLEYRSMRIDDDVIINRESFWKEFGYNNN
jgi:hypothetical protein